MSNPNEVVDVFFLNVLLIKVVVGLALCVCLIPLSKGYSFFFSLKNLIGFFLVALISNARILVDYLFNIETDCFVVQEHLSQRIVSIPFATLLTWILTGVVDATLVQALLYLTLLFTTLNLRYVITEHLTPSITVEMSESLIMIQNQDKNQQQIGTFV